MAGRYTAWFSSLWGPIGPVTRMYDRLRGQLDEPRAVRPEQPFMVLRQAPLVPSDPLARVVTMADFSAYYEASVAFFTEELGVSPERDGSSGYRVLVADLVKSGRAYARFEGDRLIAKADVALVGSGAAQVQGVYVVPARRGEGLSAADGLDGLHGGSRTRPSGDPLRERVQRGGPACLYQGRVRRALHLPDLHVVTGPLA